VEAIVVGTSNTPSDEPDNLSNDSMTAWWQVQVLFVTQQGSSQLIHSWCTTSAYPYSGQLFHNL
jgi:hypothetical protein